MLYSRATSHDSSSEGQSSEFPFFLIYSLRFQQYVFICLKASPPPPTKKPHKQTNKQTNYSRSAEVSISF